MENEVLTPVSPDEEEKESIVEPVEEEKEKIDDEEVM